MTKNGQHGMSKHIRQKKWEHQSFKIKAETERKKCFQYELNEKICDFWLVKSGFVGLFFLFLKSDWNGMESNSNRNSISGNLHSMYDNDKHKPNVRVCLCVAAWSIFEMKIRWRCRRIAQAKQSKAKNSKKKTTADTHTNRHPETSTRQDFGIHRLCCVAKENNSA